MSRVGFVFDIDGTVFKSSEGVTQKHIELFAALRDDQFAFATSRPIADIQKIFSFIHKRYFAVSNDGALSFRVLPESCARLIYTQSVISTTQAADLIEKLPLDGLPLLFCTNPLGDGPVLVPPAGMQLSKALREITPDREYIPYATGGDLLKLAERAIHEIRSVAYFTRVADQHLAVRHAGECFQHLAGAKFLSYADSRCSDGHWNELVANGVNKANGISALCSLGHLPLRIVAFGNAWNDIEMLQQAMLAIVPCDADADAKRVADEIAPEPGGERFCVWVLENLERLSNESLRV